MSLGSTRVLRERKPSRQLPEEYKGSSQQTAHARPQAYGTDLYQNHNYPISEPTTGYNSPASSNWLPDDGSGVYDGGDYGHGMPQYIGDMPLRSYHRGTPTTPARSDISIADPRYTTGTHWIRSTNIPKAKSKRPKKEKVNAGKSMMPGDKPVPILSIDCEGPIFEIEKFVHRSTEARLKEVEGKNGYTPRPMNNFMLYRKAYQDKAKQVSSQTNHQVVSVVVAASWKNESKEIKDKFARYAQVEKERHIQAFPNYQFRPNKANKARKRKYEDDEDESDDLDWGRGVGTKRTRQNVHHTLPGNYTPEPQHQYLPLPHPYPPGGYSVDYTGQGMYYDQQHQWFQQEDITWPVDNMYQDHGTQPFNPGGLSGLPGGGSALLDPDFSNAVFDAPAPVVQSSPLVPSNGHGLGAFTQGEFEALENVPSVSHWRESHASVDGKTLASAFPESNDDFGEEYFVNEA